VTRITSFDQSPEQRRLAPPCVGERIFCLRHAKTLIHSKFAEAAFHAVLSQVWPGPYASAVLRGGLEQRIPS
jgi:hypothetical protein